MQLRAWHPPARLEGREERRVRAGAHVAEVDLAGADGPARHVVALPEAVDGQGDAVGRGHVERVARAPLEVGLVEAAPVALLVKRKGCQRTRSTESVSQEARLASCDVE